MIGQGQCTISEPMVKKPPVAEDSYCYVWIFRKKSKDFKLIYPFLYLIFILKKRVYATYHCI